MRRLVVLCCALAVFFSVAARRARAQQCCATPPGGYLFWQPDCVGIPQTNRLQGYFDARGENTLPFRLSARNDASLVPEVFQPALTLTFTDVAEGAGYENAFGWYNVGDDTTIEANRHIAIEANREPTYSVTVNLCTLMCGGERCWKGGPIGFFIITPQCCGCAKPCGGGCTSCSNQGRNDIPGYIYYTEPRLNVEEQSQTCPYIHHLVYQSSRNRQAFYFGFEDLFRGGDNDFEDILVYVEGLLTSAPLESCNNLDDDCDGLTDENVFEACSTACGDGVKTCTNGVLGPCSARTPTAEQCNGIDDDCNDIVDDGVTPQPCSNACGTGVTYCVGGVMDPINNCTAPKPSTEVCDNIDNDCDGSTDEELTRDCSTVCGPGIETCIRGSYLNCTAAQPAVEVCDNVDNDCDHATDEDLVLPCATQCGPGERVCASGRWSECSAPKPAAELCDGVDNNCDGQTDELWPEKGQSCETRVKQCVVYGVYACNVAHTGLICDAQVTVEEEFCDGRDNDCDGVVDEADPLLRQPCGVCTGGEPQPCYLDEGDCHPGAYSCQNGMLVCEGEVEPGLEACDLRDNDCDGQTDENGVPEICDDRIDNDCDGLTDLFDPDCIKDCVPPAEEPCGISEGECEPGTRTCGLDGRWSECTGGIGPSPEVCDGLDNDCDGLTDEDAVPEVCDDGIDNDCDGRIDALDPDCADCEPGETRVCGEDVGECQHGFQTCNPQAHWGEECAGQIEGEPESCDGRDNDCDGLTDKGDLCGGYDTCLCGECVSACSAGECPAGNRYCVNNWCVLDPCCGLLCPAGELCGVQGRCVDPCEGDPLSCSEGTECRLGECVPVDCFTPGHECAEGQRCVVATCPGDRPCGVCEEDPCFSAVCSSWEYCHEGICLGVGCGSCGPGQICSNGLCVDSPCAGIVCETGQVCVNGECAADACQGKSCPRGMICKSGRCLGDACRDLQCPEDSRCLDGYCVAIQVEVDGGVDGGMDGDVEVEPDTGQDAGGEADAGSDSEPGDRDAGAEPDGASVTDKGVKIVSGCGCALPGANERGPGVASLFLLAGVFLLSRRRKALVLVAGVVLVGSLGACSNYGVPARDGSVVCMGPEDCQPGFQCILGDCIARPDCSDVDEDGYCSIGEGGQDCNDNRGDIHPGAEEACDGQDNNCDGRVDEGFECKTGEAAQCWSRVGICRPGTMTCENCLWGECKGGRGPDPVENCEDSLDNDCDGAVNEGCICSQGATRSCGSDLGECTLGFQDCILESGEWHWSVCSGGTPPTQEICGDKRDNDCDGSTDNGCFCEEGATRPCGINTGACRAGRQVCQDGMWGVCEGGRWPTEEICDGADNNCNRLIDEGCDCVDGNYQSCGTDAGLCRRGIHRCLAGKWGACDGEIGPADELCDGRDNDCDDLTDEDFPELGHSCEAGLGECVQIGKIVCTDDDRGTYCNAKPLPGAEEICDNKDNNCDGVTDEGFENVGVPCTAGQGECAGAGTTRCNSRGAVECSAVRGAPRDELCDQKDNDCDGFTDENFMLLGIPCMSGFGECQRAGQTICSADLNGYDCSAAPDLSKKVDEGCDNLDNDCDGEIDEELVRPCGNQWCPGAESCFAGGWIGCSAPLPMKSEVCDDVDNTCDGQIDEGIDKSSSLENCGGCLRLCDPPFGTGACVLGTCVVESCQTNHHDLNKNAVDGCEYACTIQGSETCNGLDDDCDGQTDEELGAPTIACPNVGVCTNIPPVCRNSQWECAYPSTYQNPETRCDNLDNDCDGLTDEGFPAKNTACSAGDGVCRTTGVNLCSADGLSTECTARPDWSKKQPTETCDGLDNDCNGLVDDNLNRAAEMVQVTAAGHTFWIDRYEASRPDADESSRGFVTSYPCSRSGVLPWNDVTWDQAKAACETRGKRLCTDEEWQAVCGGSQSLNFPYGDTYATATCNDFGQVGEMLPTGELASCTSEAGVLDLSGNVAEWANCVNEARDCRFVKPIFGGNYDDAIDELLTCWFRNNAGPQNHLYGLGFRCCDD